MGEIVERIGLSENFQRLVNKGNKIGTLTSSNIFVSVWLESCGYLTAAFFNSVLSKFKLLKLFY